MLPPADQAVLEANPDFANVYRTLTGSLLNPDASSRHPTRDEKRATVREELKAHRIETTKHQILKQAITQIVPYQEDAKPQKQPQTATTTTSSRLGRQGRMTKPTPPTSDPTSQNQSLPPDLLYLLTLLPPFLATAHTLPSSSIASLLSYPPFTNLQQHFTQITSLLSTALSKQASSLAKAVYPTTNPSFIHRHIPSLAITAETLTSTLSDSRRGLSQLRVTTAHALTEGYLAEHLRAITFFVDLLEVKHAPASSSPAPTNTHLALPRSARSALGDPSQAEHGQQPQVLTAHAAALLAQHYALASQALLSHAVDMIYPPEARSALATYQRHLAGARMRVADASVVRVAELKDYGIVVNNGEGDEGGGGGRGRTGSIGDENKERTMREIARVYREMEGRMREVKRDLKRLGRI